MRAKDIMTTPVVTAAKETSLKKIAELLVANDISCVPIVDETGSLIGLVSEADVLPLQGLEDPRRHIVASSSRADVARKRACDVMTINVVTVNPDDDVTMVARLMRTLGIKRLPVVEGKTVVGIISRRDILKVLARSDRSIEAELQEILDDQITMLGRFRASVHDGVVTLDGTSDDSARKLAGILARGIPGVVAVRFRQSV